MNVRELVTVLGFKVDTSGLVAYSNSLQQLKNEARNATGNLGNMLGGVATGIRNAGLVATAALSVPMTLLAKSSLQAAANLEQMRISYQTMLGSADKGNAVMEKLLIFERETPLNLQTVTSVANTLLAMGESADSLIPTMRTLGDVTRGDAEKMSRMAINIGQIKANGRAMRIDMNQFAFAGIPIWEALSKSMAKPIPIIQQMVTDGKIGYAEVMAALQGLTAEGGKFHNMMAAQAMTMGGMWSTFQSNWFKFRGAIGEMIVRGLRLDKVLFWINNKFDAFNEKFRKMPKWVKGLIVAFMALAIVIPPIVAAIGALLVPLASFITMMAGLRIAYAGAAGIISSVLALMKSFVGWSLAAAAPWLIIAGVIAFVAFAINDMWVAANGGDSVIGLLVKKWEWLHELAKWWWDTFNALGARGAQMDREWISKAKSISDTRNFANSVGTRVNNPVANDVTVIITVPERTPAETRDILGAAGKKYAEYTQRGLTNDIQTVTPGYSPLKVIR